MGLLERGLRAGLAPETPRRARCRVAQPAAAATTSTRALGRAHRPPRRLGRARSAVRAAAATVLSWRRAPGKAWKTPQRRRVGHVGMLRGADGHGGAGRRRRRGPAPAIDRRGRSLADGRPRSCRAPEPAGRRARPPRQAALRRVCAAARRRFRGVCATAAISIETARDGRVPCLPGVARRGARPVRRPRRRARGTTARRTEAARYRGGRPRVTLPPGRDHGRHRAKGGVRITGRSAR